MWARDFNLVEELNISTSEPYNRHQEYLVSQERLFRQAAVAVFSALGLLTYGNFDLPYVRALPGMVGEKSGEINLAEFERCVQAFTGLDAIILSEFKVSESFAHLSEFKVSEIFAHLIRGIKMIMGNFPRKVYWNGLDENPFIWLSRLALWYKCAPRFEFFNKSGINENQRFYYKLIYNLVHDFFEEFTQSFQLSLKQARYNFLEPSEKCSVLVDLFAYPLQETVGRYSDVESVLDKRWEPPKNSQAFIRFLRAVDDGCESLPSATGIYLGDGFSDTRRNFGQRYSGLDVAGLRLGSFMIFPSCDLRSGPSGPTGPTGPTGSSRSSRSSRPSIPGYPKRGLPSGYSPN